MFQGWLQKGTSTTASTTYCGTVVKVGAFLISSVETISSQVMIVLFAARAMFSALEEKPRY